MLCTITHNTQCTQHEYTESLKYSDNKGHYIMHDEIKLKVKYFLSHHISLYCFKHIALTVVNTNRYGFCSSSLTSSAHSYLNTVNNTWGSRKRWLYLPHYILIMNAAIQQRSLSYDSNKIIKIKIWIAPPEYTCNFAGIDITVRLSINLPHQVKTQYLDI